MKHALISPNEPRETGYRVAEVQDSTFVIAQPLFWVDCADDVVQDLYWYDPVDQNIKLVQPIDPPQELTDASQVIY